MGRPQGSKNIDKTAIQHPTRCKCGSTARTPYRDKRVTECVCTLGDGRPVTHILRQRTTCTDCSQQRIDVTYHNLPAGKTLTV